CYGFINFFDRVALWPDQVVGHCVERGVAIICQSGTLALNLLFNGRSLPIGYVLTVGNQTCLAVEDMIELLCSDDRVLAFGLYVGGGMGASGGDMAMTADASRDLGLTFAPLPAASEAKLQQLLTGKVTITNPFDFHTHIWFDAPAMRSMFSIVHHAEFDATGFMIDCPP